MGVYQDEITNNIQPMIDKLTVNIATLNTILTFLQAQASDITTADFKTACAAHASDEVKALGTGTDDSAADSEVQADIDREIDKIQVLLGTHSSLTAYQDFTTKGDSSTNAWRTGSLQGDLDALNEKKTVWLAKESDANDTTSYATIVQPA